MKRCKKILLASLACSALMAGTLSFIPSVTEAAYTLNEEVQNPTPALLGASQIGVMKYVNPSAEMANAANKDAIVILSFGTTYKETREKTIVATAQAIKNAHSDVEVRIAFTSHIVIDHIKKNEGKCDYMTPEETLAQLKKEGYTRVALVSFDLIPGMEYDYARGVFNNCKEQFKVMTLSTPLMYWQGQEEQPDDVLEFVKAVKSQLPKVDKKEAILFMAHGTPHPANAYYSVLNTRLHYAGMNNAYVYTVEGWPRLEQAIHRLKRKGYKKVLLVPLMMVAGDHATNDMAGNEEDSHKSILEKEGFTVRTYLHGVGENKNVQKIFVERANDAWNALVGK
ncbi:MAG: sirohydrochlorin cobaltochelatase [Selenomonadaceae bacterium]|nr:sirohydrochlorin cobaltochelatase [Selenomonadaceae bacterium]